MSQSLYFSASVEKWERDSSINIEEDMTQLLVGLQTYQFTEVSKEETTTVQERSRKQITV